MNETVAFFDVPETASGQEQAVPRRCLGTEAGLVLAVQAGDQIAFHRLVERYGTWVYSLVNRLLLDGGEADKVAQEVFATVYFKIGQLGHAESLSAWIYEIALNECLRRLRKRSVFRRRKGTPAPDRRHLALERLSRISNTDRTLLILREVEGYSMEEMARITGMADGELCRRLCQSRRLLAGTEGSWLRGLLGRLIDKCGFSRADERGMYESTAA